MVKRAKLAKSLNQLRRTLHKLDHLKPENSFVLNLLDLTRNFLKSSHRIMMVSHLFKAVMLAIFEYNSYLFLLPIGGEINGDALLSIVMGPELGLAKTVSEFLRHNRNTN